MGLRGTPLSACPLLGLALLTGALTLALLEGGSLSVAASHRALLARQTKEEKKGAGSRMRLPARSSVSQTGRTFWASSPLRPGATSNSTV